MPSILAQIWGLYSHQFKCLYLKNQTLFLCILLFFLDFTWNFDHSEKKIDPHNFSISEIIYFEKRGYLNA